MILVHSYIGGKDLSNHFVRQALDRKHVRLILIFRTINPSMVEARSFRVLRLLENLSVIIISVHQHWLSRQMTIGLELLIVLVHLSSSAPGVTLERNIAERRPATM